MTITRKLHRSFSLALLLCCIPMTLCAHEHGTVGSANAAPKIVFESTRHNFGTVPQNTSLKHIFAFKNQGGSPLAIGQIKGG